MTGLGLCVAAACAFLCGRCLGFLGDRLGLRGTAARLTRSCCGRRRRRGTGRGRGDDVGERAVLCEGRTGERVDVGFALGALVLAAAALLWELAVLVALDALSGGEVTPKKMCVAGCRYECDANAQNKNKRRRGPVSSMWSLCAGRKEIKVTHLQR